MRRSSILILLATLCGCTSGGAMYYQIFGPPAIPALYDLPKQPTIVLVENYRDPNDNGDADLLAHEISQELKENKVGPLIEQDKLVNFRDTRPDRFHTLNIASIGKEMGAKQVVYVDLIDSSVNPDTSMSAIEGHASARVRVVDVESGETRWPLDNQQGFTMSATLPFTRADPDRATEIHASLLDKLSSSIAKLFYAWKPLDDSDTASESG